ncbi:MAG: aldose 1-epimerase family protein [Candidatus Dormibacteraeota bacterium]|uniref:Aldose 1-epimerase family protein n=1 Tax=Candidatus Aeolococcus gillhamiae TaxID=3127015 RepID=A0A2W5ZCX9_9BACT|nr:aldose 1-epimerase family protein [Candidatus Dormibacteraeota bacterium]PZR81817.1 MAG: aldose epimerase [Candidatus Dormibacter sp. RRmetagenome_bin12]
MVVRPYDGAVPASLSYPSGEQIEISRDGHRATIVEVSGGVRTYDVDGRTLLDGYEAGELCSGGRGQLLVPWPNRLCDGRYEFDGQAYDVPLSEPDKQNAIHGFLRWESWRIAERAEDRVVMEHTLHPRAGYPFALHTSVEYGVGADGLTATVTATNVGGRRSPYGMGVHPYLLAGDAGVDDVWVEAPARRYLTVDDRQIPTGVADVEGTRYDFRRRRQVGKEAIDTAFTDVARDADGRAWVRVWSGDQTHGVGLWMDERYPFYMLFTGDTLPAREQRRRSLAVEPMTCAPNAFASGDGLIVLAPGESVVSRWGIAPLSGSG